MATLTKGIAQEIVNRTMQILNYNINVMDEYGVIVGSGDKDRIGEIHAGALLMIEQKKEWILGYKKESV